jgi:hypothetical protein
MTSQLMPRMRFRRQQLDSLCSVESNDSDDLQLNDITARATHALQYDEVHEHEDYVRILDGKRIMRMIPGLKRD